MSRPRRYTREQIVEALDTHLTINATARALSMSRWGVRYYMRTDNITIPPKRACLPQWIEDHPGLPLPRSIQEITDMTGCSQNAVKSYLKRERKQTLDAAKALGSFTHSPPFRIGKTIVRPSAMVDTSYGVDPYTFNILVRGTYPDGEKIRFYLPLRKLRILLNGTRP